MQKESILAAGGVSGINKCLQLSQKQDFEVELLKLAVNISMPSC